MVEVKSVTVKPSLAALLTGNLALSEVTLVEPTIVLEIDAAGKPNWDFTPSIAEARPAGPKPDSPRPLSVGRLAIEDGTLIFRDSKDRSLGSRRKGRRHGLATVASTAPTR